jgi:hypothetical protein
MSLTFVDFPEPIFPSKLIIIGAVVADVEDTEDATRLDIAVFSEKGNDVISIIIY